jgi:hypothetical protein
VVVVVEMVEGRMDGWLWLIITRLGGKMDGSTMILFVHPTNHEKIKSIMSDHILLNSSMDISGFVSQEVFSGISNCCE